jgi:hypothetical protein
VKPTLACTDRSKDFERTTLTRDHREIPSRRDLPRRSLVVRARPCARGGRQCQRQAGRRVPHRARGCLPGPPSTRGAVADGRGGPADRRRSRQQDPGAVPRILAGQPKGSRFPHALASARFRSVDVRLAAAVLEPVRSRSFDRHGIPSSSQLGHSFRVGRRTQAPPPPCCSGPRRYGRQPCRFRFSVPELGRCDDRWRPA